MSKEKKQKEKTPVPRAVWVSLGAAVGLIALGLFAILWPDLSLNTICVVIGAVALVFGIIEIIIYFMTKPAGVGMSHDFSIGALAVIVGVILLIHPGGIVDLLQVLIGIFLLADSVFKMQTAFDSKRIGISGWWITLIFTVACLVLGILMVLKVGANVIMVLIGVALIIDGIQNLCLVVFSRIAAKKLARMDKDGDGMPDIIDVTDEQEPDGEPAPEQPAQPDAAAEDAAAPIDAVPEEENTDNNEGGKTE